METATVDVGNTSVKVTLFADDCSIKCRKRYKDVAEAASEMGGQCGGVIFCTTRTLTEEERLKADSAGWIEFHPGLKTPLEICYGSPSTLGPDRVAAAVGATVLYPGETLMVVDAGTALTVDVVTADGRYLGGNISPGVEMRFRALHEFTSRLPLAAWPVEKNAFGSDTLSAIGCGVKWGITCEVAGLFRMAARELGCRLAVVSGGDGPLLVDALDELPERIPLKYEPDILAYGLLEVYKKYER